MLLLRIAKWRNLLISQLLVYNGDRQASPDLLNLLQEETDLDPDTWLMHHMSILAFLHRIANASISKRDSLRNWYISTRSYECWISPNLSQRTHCTWTLVYGRHFTHVGEPPTQKDTVVHTTSCRILQVVHSASHW